MITRDPTHRTALKTFTPEHRDFSAQVLTPPGRSAIAVIRLSGLADRSVLNGCFQPKYRKSFSEIEPGKIVFGTWTNQDGGVEELVVAVCSDSEVEIHCHGGVAAQHSILDTLQELGVRILRPGQVSTAHGQVDPRQTILEAEIQQGLVSAPTLRIANLFLKMTAGGFEAGVQRLIESIRAESELAADRIEDSLSTYPVGEHLFRPFEVVLSGKPNVGKSSLGNALLGFQRSIVLDQPGTTRDTLSGITTIDGFQYRLTDTAGIRETLDPIEKIGVERALDAARNADLWVQITEAPRQLENPEQLCDSEVAGVSEQFRIVDSGRSFTVLNKVDLLPKHRRSELEQRFPSTLMTSVMTGEGIPELLDAIACHTVGFPPEDADVLIFTERQRDWMTEARKFARLGDLEVSIEKLMKMMEEKTSDAVDS